MEQEKEGVLTPNQIATEWQIDPATIRRYIREGQLVATRVGKQYRIRRRDWEEFLARNNPPRDLTDKK